MADVEIGEGVLRSGVAQLNDFDAVAVAARESGVTDARRALTKVRRAGLETDGGSDVRALIERSRTLAALGVDAVADAGAEARRAVGQHA